MRHDEGSLCVYGGEGTRKEDLQRIMKTELRLSPFKNGELEVRGEVQLPLASQCPTAAKPDPSPSASPSSR